MTSFRLYLIMSIFYVITFYVIIKIYQSTILFKCGRNAHWLLFCSYVKKIKEAHATSGEDAFLSEPYFRFSPPTLCGARESACATEPRHTHLI